MSAYDEWLKQRPKDARDMFLSIYPPTGVPPRPWSLHEHRKCLCTTEYELASPPESAPGREFPMILGRFSNAPAAAAFAERAVNAFDALVAIAKAAEGEWEPLQDAVGMLDQAFPKWREWA